MGLDLSYINGQTPLDEDEKQGLRIPSIATRMELDEFEQQNIEKAMLWLVGKSFKTNVIFTEAFICNLHKRMYGDVWAWAGQFRKTNKNLGVDSWQIPMELKMLCDDTLYWVENKTYAPDEIAIRFKHRIVSIHCFPNGNGRHSRLMADIIVEKIFGNPVFSWGAVNLLQPSTSRNTYIQSLKTADQAVINDLLAFARA